MATIFDPAAGRELEQEIGNCTITSLADIVAPTLRDRASTTTRGGARRRAGGPALLRRRGRGDRAPRGPRPPHRAFATAIIKPFDRSAALVFGASAWCSILVAETIAAVIVLEQQLIDAFYGAVKTLVTVDPNPAVQDEPEWFKLAISSAHARSPCCSPPRSPAASSSA